MARSPLTLAASVTSALPRVVVTSVGSLSEGTSGRYDSAIAHLEDGRRVVVRVPVDDDADADLRAEARALTSLTPGVRAVLPFGAPDVLGQTRVDGRHTLVQTLLPGYRVDAAHVPAGRGIATALATATAQVHDLPVTVVRDAGLPVQTAAAVRDEAEKLLDAAEATGRLPFGLLRRWSTALASDRLWRFETTVVLGGADPASFVFEDDAEGVPIVTGLLSWGGLAVSDPAIDLRWTASAPAARDDVLDAYARASHRAPDPQLAERARLHAELEFAKWLVHGHTTGSEEIIADAVALLDSLAESVRDQPAVHHDAVTADEAIAASERVPAAAGPIDTSMHTDTFDAETLAGFMSNETAAIDTGEADATVPVELSAWTGLREETGVVAPATSDGESAATAEAPVTSGASGEEPRDADVDSAARNALRRWTGTI
ncbi:MAG: aminoglycoside phosphotransferase [Microbacterium sp. SCN 70-200]|uniref:aminoglycoside phosphotransferase n=1 Tax=unclassified Microbacterium TaxID=2609290 RepID=UPI0008688A28|nr:MULTISPECIES: aminoglycoside phosphotransferase [unclassified Microbacterium]MBN9213233.1 aminoglycoside phosphotransferase [Microbacterium sp.]ODT40698.1 MAG: aminoglycoside phosphotransferase [Microbacterium sp. SCN 70-200]OJV83695.1 MAG: aminoglycoside phosphotransferase [Microbacterium sp. 70-16]